MLITRLAAFAAALVLLAAMYWSPTLIAFGRGASHRTAIALVNSLTGWTIIGWAATLLWSVAAEAELELEPVTPREGMGTAFLHSLAAMVARLSPTHLARG